MNNVQMSKSPHNQLYRRVTAKSKIAPVKQIKIDAATRAHYQAYCHNTREQS